MVELDSQEFLFLKRVDEALSLRSSEGVSAEDLFEMFGGYHRDPNRAGMVIKMLDRLVKKEVVVSSPDGVRFKLTNYGNQLFLNKLREEKEWINQGPFVKLNPEKKEEIDIKQGEHFKGYWEITEILKRAKKLIKIQDAYIGRETIAILNELDESIEIKVLTTDKRWKHKDLSMVAFELFKKGRKGKTEIKVNNAIHSRRLIIDDLEVYQSDESLKDIGVHNAAKITRLFNIEEELVNFDNAWKEAA